MEQFQKQFDFFLKIFPITYLIGFIVINGFLSNYSFSEYDILNLTYLKAGIFVVIYLGIHIFIYVIINTERYIKDKSFIYKVLQQNIALNFMNFIVLCLIYPNIVLKYYHYFLITFSLFLVTLIVRHIIGGTIASLIIIIVFFVTIYLINPKNGNLFIFYLISTIVGIFVFSAVSYLRVYKNDYLTIFSFTILLISGAYYFGQNVYQFIPSNLGGIKSYKIIIDTSIIVFDKKPLNDTIDILYENESKYLIKTSLDNVFCVDKSLLPSYLIVNKTDISKRLTK